MSLTDTEKAAMRERHRSDMGHLIDGDSGVPVCPTCRRLWPCDAERLLDALDEAEWALIELAPVAQIERERIKRLTLEAALRNPSDEVVEAVSMRLLQRAYPGSTNSTLLYRYRPTARAAIAALADALGVGSDDAR